MNINDFKREFKQVNFVYLGDGIILFRKPLEIFDVSAWLKKNQKKYGYKYSYTPAKR